MELSSTPPDTSTVSVEAVEHAFGHGPSAVHCLRGASLDVRAGEVVAVSGPSGSGKSTLLHLIAGFGKPDRGRVLLAGVDWQSLDGDARAVFRRRACGFVFQGFSLLPQATAAENVELPLLLDGADTTTRAALVAEALDQVGLRAEAPKLPDQLSGGQQQRVAIARALVLEPAVILADEPTGNLDSSNAHDVARLLITAARERDAAVVLVTHDPTIAEQADRTLRLRAGRLEAVVDGSPERD
jgi:putative ABC transport system ATP-binding protein